jgi:hypothetical protein
MKAFKITFLLTAVIVLFASSLSSPASAAEIPAFKTTNHYKALANFTEAMKTRSQKRTVTNSTAKSKYLKKLTSLANNARAKSQAIFQQRSSQAWNNNRARFSADTKKIAADYEAIKQTILIEFRQTKLDMDQSFAAELRGINEDWADYIRPQVQKADRLNKAVRKAKKTMAKLSKARKTSKVRKAIKKSRKVIKASPSQIKLANKRANYWKSQRAIYIKEAREQYNIEVIAEQNQLKLDLADNQKELEDEIVSLDDNWKSVFEDQKSRLADLRSNEYGAVSNLQSAAKSAISSLPTKK